MKVLFKKKFKIKFLMLLVFISLFVYPAGVLAAEILQVRASTLVQLGDRNRSYLVKLACIDILPSNEDKATVWLRDQLPRRSKVKIFPQSSIDGILVAKIFPIKSEVEISQRMSQEGLGTLSC